MPYLFFFKELPFDTAFDTVTRACQCKKAAQVCSPCKMVVKRWIMIIIIMLQYLISIFAQGP